MVIYVDLVFITTILVNYLFIKAINILFNSKISIWRMMFSLLISVISLLFYIVPYEILWNLRHLYGIIIGIIAFKDHSKSQKILKILIFYLMNYLLIGTLAIFEIKSIVWLIIVTILIIIVFFIEYFLKQRMIIKKQSESNDYFFDNKALKTLIDTGNQCFYQGLMVSFLDEKFFDERFILVGEMLTKSILGEKLINIYIGPPIIINNEELITYYSFMKIDNYDLIVGKGEEND